MTKLTKEGNDFSQELLSQSMQYSRLTDKSPDAALLSGILSILATSTPEQLLEIYNKISGE